MEVDLKNFMFINDQFNIIIYAKYFKKQKNYDELMNHIYAVIEGLIKINKIKFNTEKIVTYIDLKEYKRKEIDYDFLKKIIPILQEKYAENLEGIYVTNSSFFIKAIYTIIRPFIDKVTRKKIFFLKKDKNNTKQFSEENIDKLFE